MIIFMSQDLSESGLEEDNIQSEVQRVDSSNAVLAYCILFSLPVVSASGTIMLRNLKSLKHPMTVTFHVSMVSIPFMIVVAMVVCPLLVSVVVMVPVIIEVVVVVPVILVVIVQVVHEHVVAVMVWSV